MEFDKEALKRLRAEHAYSLRELAERAGTTQDNIWKLENGVTKRPHPGTIRKLAAALEVAPVALQRPIEDKENAAGTD